MIEDIAQIKKDYKFEEPDVENIKKLAPILQAHGDEFMMEFYDFIFRFAEAKKYLKDEEIIHRHKTKVREWFLELFDASYDAFYFAKLYKVGEVHVKIGLPTHYVNASFNFVRNFVIQKISQNFPADAGEALIESINKLLDINLDMLTSAYRTEELSSYAVMSRFEKRLLGFSRRFADFLNFSMVGALIMVSFFVIGLFFYDVYKLVFSLIPFDEGIVTILGSLLVLWAVLELMEEEIGHLKGRHFAISAFIGLALAAMIRKILIASLSTEKIVALAYYGGTILALGIVYWLISKREQNH